MIPVHRWEFCVVSPQTLKFLNLFSFSIFKKSNFAAGHFHITMQMLSVNPQDY
jgi:hypothetical protein